MFGTHAHGMAASVEEKESQTFELISIFSTRALIFPDSHWLWEKLPLLASSFFLAEHLKHVSKSCA
jgi:hypothetical protein